MRRLLPLLCGLLLAACGQRAARPIGDFTLPVYTPRYASGFEITGAAGSRSTLVTVHNPWYGDEVTDQYLFIARDGEPAPAGFEGQVLRDEARRVVCMSGSYIAMLDALGAADRVVGVSGAQYLINETLRRRIARGEAADVGFDSNVDFERLMALRPDLVMLFGIGGADTALTGKLRELGIPYLYMGEHCEESPLGKSEWVVVAAEIAGLRTEGSRLFAAIPERYERLRALAQQTAARPRVMLNTPYRDTWFMPARNSYMVRLLEDAGARYVFEENTATQTLPIDIEQAYYLTSKSDFWLNVSDEDAERYVKIFTMLDRETIEGLVAAHREAPHLRGLQKALACEVTCMVHGEEEYRRAVEASEILFGGATAEALRGIDEQTFLQVFEGVPRFEISRPLIERGVGFLALCTEHAAVFPSKGEARKLIQGGGVSLNKRKIAAVDCMVGSADLLSGRYLLVQKGKKNYYLIVVTD